MYLVVSKDLCPEHFTGQWSEDQSFGLQISIRQDDTRFLHSHPVGLQLVTYLSCDI